ncbi:WecB/TagA/CpsF family glycosyltransferase [Lacibacterium aquatile]|uniref:WecB/TagA/CpsF family glycosyltransferase n=1 Tax=Lacibacterium aquatile TaxID=1168082 RepID=A0ABW5E064_9PROT
MTSTIDLFGYRISSQPLAPTVAAALEAVDDKRTCSYLACANPHSVVEADHDPAFRRALCEADMLVPDGAGIVLAAKLLKLAPLERLAGHDVFTGVMSALNARGRGRIFFLGSTPAVLAKIRAQVAKDYPNLSVVGVYSPPFRERFSDDDNDAMISAINDSAPDVLWVGMTAPKQEKWLHEHRDRLAVPFAGAIGAVFDFYAGTKKRSPEWSQKMGLEWLPRLMREPRRLWRRNFVSSPLFLAKVAGQMVRSPASR